MHRTPIEQPEDLHRKSCSVWTFHKITKGESDSDDNLFSTLESA